MKKYVLFFTLVLLSSSSFAQKNNKVPTPKKAEKEKPIPPKEEVVTPAFTKIKVIENYERVLEKGYKTEAMLQAVADYRFFEEDLITAAKWYTQLFEFCPDELEAVYYYRYAQSLKSIGQTEKANEMMALFQSKKI
jgi:tetratricopeptide (TPR) repeat protein